MPDCIREFRAAANERFEDGMTLALGERRTAAIYLWGYAAEMTLKAAVFAVNGFDAEKTISIADLAWAKNKAKDLGIIWTVNYHNLYAWAELLVTIRATTMDLGYPSASFPTELLDRCGSLQRLWSEVLRYHKNRAYVYELADVREATEWLLANSAEL